MIVSTTQHITVYRQTIDGRPSTGKVTADFTAYATLAGATSALSLTVTERSTIGNGRAYDIAFTAPGTTGDIVIRFAPTAGNDLIFPDVWADQVTVYGIDSIGALISTTSAVPATDFSTSSQSEIFHGDSLQFDLSVSESALLALGAASLAAIDTLACGVKLTSRNSADAQDATLSTAIVSDTSGNRVVRVNLDAFPAALAIATALQSVSARVDLRATEGTKTFIVATLNLTIKWRATTA